MLVSFFLPSVNVGSPLSVNVGAMIFIFSLPSVKVGRSPSVKVGVSFNLVPSTIELVVYRHL